MTTAPPSNDGPPKRKRRKRPQSELRKPRARRINHPPPDELTEVQCYELFLKARYAATDGQPHCPHKNCRQCTSIYTYKPRWNRSRTTFTVIYKCQWCGRQFRATSHTPFRYHKMTFKQILCAVWEFVAGESTGLPALKLSLKKNYDYKSAWVFFHKLRYAMRREQASIWLGDEVEIDGMEMSGYVRPKNARKKKEPNDKAKTKKNPYRMEGPVLYHIFSARQRGGGPVRTCIVPRETDAMPWVESVVSKAATIYSDMKSDFSVLDWQVHDPVKQRKLVNHSENFCSPEAHTNNAENFNSMVERMQKIYRIITHPKYRHVYPEELAWRMTNMKLSVGDKFQALLQAIGAAGPFTIKNAWRGKRPELAVA